jgi:hypothetical protein
MSLHDIARDQLQRQLARAGSDEEVLNAALRLLAKYRSTLIQNTLVATHGTRVHGGPFAGMDFVETSSEGCHVPKLLGCYEEELHAFLAGLPSAGYQAIVNIGCAEGYYAVGMKRLVPSARVLAFDIDARARSACEGLARRNSVEVEVGGEFRHADFAPFATMRTLVWCDIEGAEVELLDPARAPALAGIDLVVELHVTPQGQAGNVVLPRFAATHDIAILHARSHQPQLPPFLQQLGHLDQLLAQWEWRSQPTPWAILRSKAPGGAPT